MRILLFLFLALYVTMPDRAVLAQAQTPVTLNNETFKVPRPGKASDQNQRNGVEKLFTLYNKTNVTLSITSDQPKPLLNVFVMGEADFAKYQVAGDLKNLAFIRALGRSKTLGFTADAILEPGKYALLIQWARRGFFLAEPTVGLKLIAQDNGPRPLEPTPVPTYSFWQRLFWY